MRYRHSELIPETFENLQTIPFELCLHCCRVKSTLRTSSDLRTEQSSFALWQLFVAYPCRVVWFALYFAKTWLCRRCQRLQRTDHHAHALKKVYGYDAHKTADWVKTCVDVPGTIVKDSTSTMTGHLEA